MNTEDLIDRLSEELKPAPQRALVVRLGAAALIGSAAALLAMLALIGLRPDIAVAVREGSFWMKAAYTSGLAVAGFLLVERVSRPGQSGGGNWLIALAIVALAAGLGVWELVRAPSGLRPTVLMGHSWSTCMTSIAALSLPGLFALLWAMRSLAPTRLRLAGLAAGLLAGGLGATVYGLSCVESTAAFMAAWYSLGILAVGALGAMAGPRVLRW
jgi:hypothetical protein